MAHHGTLQRYATPSEPEARPPTRAAMRALWRQYPDPEVRNLLLEIMRLRGLVRELADYHASVNKVWREEVGGQLVALEKMRQLFAVEPTKGPGKIY